MSQQAIREHLWRRRPIQSDRPSGQHLGLEDTPAVSDLLFDPLGANRRSRLRLGLESSHLGLIIGLPDLSRGVQPRTAHGGLPGHPADPGPDPGTGTHPHRRARGRLGEDFTLAFGDVPAEPERPEPGRDLPAQIMRQLCEHLPLLEQAPSGREIRCAVELLTDTGRRPDEILRLPG